MSLWTSRKLSNICVAAAAIVLLLLDLLQLAIFYRCPHCGRLLPFRQWAGPLYCPYCGRELNAQNPDR